MREFQVLVCLAKELDADHLSLTLSDLYDGGGALGEGLGEIAHQKLYLL